MKKTFTISLVLICFFIPALSQNDVRKSSVDLGTEIPVIYSAGLTFPVYKQLDLNFRTGILTYPYDRAIISILDAFVNDKALTGTIGEAFSYGICFKSGINYLFRSLYTGIHYSFLSLTAKDTPVDLINNYYGLNLPISYIFEPVVYMLRSDLHNAGLVIGKNFRINEQIVFSAEFSVMKTFLSNTRLESSRALNIIDASTLIHNKLEDYYLAYGWIPTINLYFRFQTAK